MWINNIFNKLNERREDISKLIYFFTFAPLFTHRQPLTWQIEQLYLCKRRGREKDEKLEKHDNYELVLKIYQQVAHSASKARYRVLPT